MPVLTPHTAAPRCRCIVDLLSKVQRPFLFLVTVFGEPPHAFMRKYHVRAPDDASAAGKGLELFTTEFSPRHISELTASNVPKAKQE